MPLRLAVLFVLALVLGAACAGPRANQNVCPESRNVRCLTPMRCELDTRRGCDICVCDSPPYTPVDNPHER